MKDYYRMTPQEIDEEKKRKKNSVSSLADSLVKMPNFTVTPTAETRQEGIKLPMPYPIENKPSLPLPNKPSLKLESDTSLDFKNKPSLLPYEENSYNVAMDRLTPKQDFWERVREKKTGLEEDLKESSLGKAWDTLSNSGIGKFVDRIGDRAANLATAETSNIDPRDTGSKLANFGADVIGGGIGMMVNPGGNPSFNQILRPVGKLGENAATNLTKNAPKLVQSLLPTMVREGVEQGVQEFTNASVNDKGNALEEGLKGLGQGALFAGAMKGTTDYALPMLKNTVTKNKTKLPSLMEPTKPLNDVSDDLIPIKNQPLKMPISEFKAEVASTTELPMPKSNIGERSFISNSVMDSKVIPEEIKSSLKDNPIEYAYTKHNNNDTLNKARDYVSNNFNKAVEGIKGKTSLESDFDTAVAIEVQRKLIQDGDFEGAKNWSLRVAELGTSTGQAVQYFSVLKRFTPEWTLNYVQKEIDKSLTPKQRDILKNTPTEQIDDVAKKFKIPHLSNEATKKIIEMSSAISSLEDGRAKDEAIARLQKYAGEQIPSSVLSKINNFQVVAMLSSPKTAIRNTVSNTMFAGLNTIKDTTRAGLDKGISMFTGKRTATLPDLKASIKGMSEGINETWLDFKNNVDTRNADKMELTNKLPWKEDGGLFDKAMIQLNRIERAALSDRPFEGFAYAKEYANQEKLAKLNGIKFNKADAIEKAKKVALYETFNDDNYMSNIAINLKRTLNAGKEWGFGDIIMRFAKTPASIAQRAVDYSIGGFTKAIKAAVNKDGFDQETFTNELAKSVTGAGLVGVGYSLKKLGVLNTDEEKNSNARALNQSVGLGDFRINLSGLNRAVRGGDSKLDIGDLHISYDWMQPISVLMSLGSELASEDKEVSNKAQTLLEGLFSGFNGLVDQPMTQGLQNLFGTGDFAESGKKFIASIPQTFVPSVVNNFKQMINNESRETYNPNTFKQGLNQAQNRIPGLANMLPIKKDLFGEDREVYQNKSNNALNVLLNPAITTRYLPMPYAKNAMELYDKTGDTSILPKVAPKTITINGVKYKLSPEEMIRWQETIGKEAKNIYDTQRTDTKSVAKELNKATEKAREEFLKSRKLPMIK